MSVDEVAAYAKRFSPSVRRDTTVEQLIEKAQEASTGKGTGWEGNFETMALKTVIRRLLSKYGYLSIEMQNAMINESSVESSAQATREAMVTSPDTAIDLDADSYVEVKDEPHNSSSPTATTGVDENETPDY